MSKRYFAEFSETEFPYDDSVPEESEEMDFSAEEAF